jgi:hypothetical protein
MIQPLGMQWAQLAVNLGGFAVLVFVFGSAAHYAFKQWRK